MRVLLDTHTFIWFNILPEKLSSRARALCEDKNTQLYLSVISAWEIKIKVQLEKLILPMAWDKMVTESQYEDGLRLLPLELAHLTQGRTLPYHHRDPFDRLLINQSQVEGIPIMSVDSQFKHYDVELIW